MVLRRGERNGRRAVAEGEEARLFADKAIHDDHHQVDGALPAEGVHCAVVGDIERDELGMVGDPRIARRGVEIAAIGDQARLRELPRQRMLASARSQQQDVHARLFFFR